MLGIVSGVLIPNYSFATTTEPVKEDRDVCKNILGFSTALNRKIIEKESKLKTKKEEIIRKIADKRLETEKKRIAYNTQFDEKRTEHFIKLEGNATSIEAKAQIKKFRESVGNAITLRRTTVDQVMSEFKKGMDNLTSERKENVDTLVSAFTSKTKKIMDETKNNCINGNPKSKESVKLELKNLRGELENGIKELHGIVDKTAQLIEIRDQGLLQAHDTFRETLDILTKEVLE